MKKRMDMLEKQKQLTSQKDMMTRTSGYFSQYGGGGSSLNEGRALTPSASFKFDYGKINNVYKQSVVEMKKYTSHLSH